MNPLHAIREIVLDVIFPPICLFCEKDLHTHEKSWWLCRACETRLTFFDCLQCAVCGSRLPEGKKICHLDVPYRLGAAAPYDNPVVQRLIWKLKYEHQTAATRPLAKILAHFLKTLALPLNDRILIPIPLHSARERERGFNQATLIAQWLQKEIPFIILPRALARTKSTPPQAGLEDRNARRENMAGAFAVVKPDAVRGKHIILLDDVATSGATLTEAAKTLKSAGAKDVVALVVARAGV